MRISDLLDVMEDDTVPVREKEIIASGRIMEVTMAKINAEIENNNTTKKLSRGAIAAIAAAACLLLTVTAFATGFMNRMVNWQGDQVDVAVPMPTPIPTENAGAFRERDAALDEAINEALDHEQGRDFVVARTEGHASAPQRIETLQSVDKLKDLLARDDSGLDLPFSVPEGYTFLTGYVSYDLAEGYAYELVSSETKDSGVVVERYTAPEEGDFVSGYMLLFANAAGDELMFAGDLMEESAHMAFGYEETDTVTKIKVKNMDDALMITRASNTRLYMRKALAKPISYVDPLIAVDGPYDIATEFDGIVYKVDSDVLDGNALLALLTH